MNCSGQEGGPHLPQQYPGFEVHVWFGFKAHWPRVTVPNYGIDQGLT